MLLKPLASSRAVASTLSVLLAMQAPGSAFAAALVRIAPLRAGLSAPIVLTSSLHAPLRSPLSVLPSLTPSLTPSPLIQQAPTPLIVAPSPLSSMAGAVFKALEAAGPIQNASPGDAKSLGGKIHGLITGESSRAMASAPQGPVDGGGASTPKKGSGLEPSATPLQKMMLRTLDQVAAVYTEHYAPIEWKQSQMGVNLRKEHQQARAKILAKPDITQRQFQVILAGFVAATRDYHASIQFASTEKATLPVTIVRAEGKYYLGYIDRQALPETKFPFQVGDEVVEFGGKPVEQAVAELNSVPNTTETDARLSEMRLTSRSRRSSTEVPQGDVALKIKADGAVKDAVLTWNYKADAVPLDIPIREGGLGTESDSILGDDWRFPDPEAGFKAAFRKALLKIMPSMAHPGAKDFASLAAGAAENGFTIGGKNSFVPDLGTIVWELPPHVAERLPFKAYIYKNAKGQNIGYIRVSDYSGDKQSAALFAKLIETFEKQTDGLVLDQVNNPGGSLFFMYSLLSMLTGKPLDVPKHRMIIDENDAVWAAEVLRQLAEGQNHDAEQSVLAEEMDGLKEDQMKMMDGLRRYAQFILDELKAGRRLTGPTALFGLDTINPHPQTHYSKPLVVLVNELDFSCADFFPAILQDNKRAVIFGVRTSGAGGAVKSVEFPNQQGIAGVNYTWTFAQRPGGSPIENLGITPDVAYELTAQDLKRGFSGYAKALNSVLSKMIGDSPAQVEESKPAAVLFPAKAWRQATKVLAAEGKELEPAAAAELISAFVALPGSVFKAVERISGEEKHTLLSYGDKKAVEGYLLINEKAGQTSVFWLSHQGEAFMAARTGSNGSLEEKPVSELSGAFQKEVAFWSAPGLRSQAKP